MEIQDLLNKVDHTLLSTTATWEEIRSICDDGMRFHTASVCIPPCYVKRAADYVKGGVPICTVIGFPNGYATTIAKCAEAADAVRNGAAEIDMVVNLGMVKDGRYEEILSEIDAVKKSCDGRLLKVIIETCKLTEVEKIALCDVVSRSTADYIKTSTGFGGGGATFHDVELLSMHCKGKKVKAAGGIRSIEDAEKFIELGADRLGTSKVVGEVKSILNEKKHTSLSYFS
ncbi:MAG: deoxyribose-phosphate aldolase [Lachnospiraceae bacterium]|nr:deoxyribose-phosphate aldolase [Lachnospiraceae bacterium]